MLFIISLQNKMGLAIINTSCCTWINTFAIIDTELDKTQAGPGEMPTYTPMIFDLISP